MVARSKWCTAETIFLESKLDKLLFFVAIKNNVFLKYGKPNKTITENDNTFSFSFKIHSPEISLGHQGWRSHPLALWLLLNFAEIVPEIEQSPGYYQTTALSHPMSRVSLPSEDLNIAQSTHWGPVQIWL